MKEIEFTTKGRIKINGTGMNTMYVDVPNFPTGQYKEIQFSPTIVAYPPMWETELIEKAEIAKLIEVRYKELESRFLALEGNVFPAGEVEALQERVRVAELQRDEARAALQEAQKAQTVPKEELEVLREIAHITRPRCRKMDKSALLDAVRRLDALRSSAQAGESNASPL